VLREPLMDHGFARTFAIAASVYVIVPGRPSKVIPCTGVWIETDGGFTL